MLVVSAHPELDDHDSGPAHPERPGRLDAALAGVRDLHLGSDVEWLPPRLAELEELATVHDPEYLETLAATCSAGGGRLDPDTRAGAGSWTTARLTAGAGLAAVDALESGLGDAALAFGRPPGHHAGRDVAMGFCLINNVAVAAGVLSRRGQRVAIIDWDVHHGNGTQDIFWADPSVLYVSVHQWPLYPGTGRPTERGAADGAQTTVNLPLPPGCAGDTYLALFDEVVAPQVETFAPDWVFVSAGFDAHRDDPLASMCLTAGDFSDLTARVAAMAPQKGRLVFFLEGGYDLAAIRSSVATCTARLSGHPYRAEPASAGGVAMDLVGSYRDQFGVG